MSKVSSEPPGTIRHQLVSLGRTCATLGGPLEARKVWGRAPTVEQDLFQESTDVGPSSCRLPASLGHLICKLGLVIVQDGVDWGL